MSDNAAIDAEWARLERKAYAPYRAAFVADAKEWEQRKESIHYAEALAWRPRFRKHLFARGSLVPDRLNTPVYVQALPCLAIDSATALALRIPHDVGERRQEASAAAWCALKERQRAARKQ